MVAVIIEEYDKVRLKTGEIARISEVLEEGVAYIADIFKDGKGASIKDISIEQVLHEEIASVFKEVEHLLN